MSTPAITPDAPQQMTSQQFAASVRSKYPGVYDSLSDDDLTGKVVAKYPQYKSVISQPQAQTQPQQSPGLLDTVKNWATNQWHQSKISQPYGISDVQADLDPSNPDSRASQYAKAAQAAGVPEGAAGGIAANPEIVRGAAKGAQTVAKYGAGPVGAMAGHTVGSAVGEPFLGTFAGWRAGRALGPKLADRIPGLRYGLDATDEVLSPAEAARNAAQRSAQPSRLVDEVKGTTANPEVAPPTQGSQPLETEQIPREAGSAPTAADRTAEQAELDGRFGSSSSKPVVGSLVRAVQESTPSEIDTAKALGYKSVGEARTRMGDAFDRVVNSPSKPTNAVSEPANSPSNRLIRNMGGRPVEEISDTAVKQSMEQSREVAYGQYAKHHTGAGSRTFPEPDEWQDYPEGHAPWGVQSPHR